MLTSSETRLARIKEMWEIIDPTFAIPSDQKVWLCLHCLDLPDEHPWMTSEKLEHHLQYSCVAFFRYRVSVGLTRLSTTNSHEVEEDPQVNVDYVKDFAAPELYATSTLFEATVIEFPEYCSSVEPA
jgi:hypothetical protein